MGLADPADGDQRLVQARGALAASDTTGQGRWVGLIETDPKNAELLAAIPGKTALAAGRIVRPRTDVEITKEDTNDVLRAYLSASRDPRQRGAIYRKELRVAGSRSASPAYFRSAVELLPVLVLPEVTPSRSSGFSRVSSSTGAAKR